MPKGSVPEREVICRACGASFLSTLVGKASFYCHTPRCDKVRREQRLVVPNSSGPDNGQRAVAGLPQVAVEVMALQAAREREAARFEREWRRECDRWLAVLERKRLRREVREAREDLKRRAVAANRTAVRRQREKLKEIERARARIDRLRPRVQRAVATADELRGQLRDLERAAGSPGTDLSTPTHGVAAERSPFDDDLLTAVRSMLDRRPAEPEPGRDALRKAIVGVANARGLPGTHAALRRLVVEALAWDRCLPLVAQLVRGIDTPQYDEREDIAA